MAVTLVNVWLTVKNSIWCWLWGLASAALFGVVFYQSSLMANMWLQVIFYLPMQVIGWLVWLRGGPQKNDDLPVSRLKLSGNLLWLAATVGLTVMLYAYLRIRVQYSQQPLMDAVTTAISVIAQILMTRKYQENWIYWTLVNCLYAFYLLPGQKLSFSTFCYLVLLVFAIKGWFDWERIWKQQKVQQAPSQ